MTVNKGEIGSRLKLERLKRGDLTLERVAEDLKRLGHRVSHMTLSRLERGKSEKIDLDVLRGYGQYLGLTEGWWMQKEADPVAYSQQTDLWRSPEWKAHRKLTKAIEQVFRMYRQGGTRDTTWARLENLLDGTVGWKEEDWESLFRSGSDAAEGCGAKDCPIINNKD